MQRRMAPVHLRFETLTGAAIQPVLPALSALRIAVFRAWPYLYDGSLDHEQHYLAAYAAAPGSAIIVCRDGDRVVGAATCAPMAQGQPAVRATFTAAGLDPAAWCYFGESVLLPEYRGQGAGLRFFLEREAHARALGLSHAAFCAVQRSADDPRRPPGYVPLDAFWRKRGYTPCPDLHVTFDWQELGDAHETSHVLGFWTRSL
jgi:GNAT superfamily N-acetyltransferase